MFVQKDTVEFLDGSYMKLSLNDGTVNWKKNHSKQI